MARNVLPIAFLQAGRDATVKDTVGGRGLNQRLAEMGIARGTKIRVIKNDTDEPLIISIGEGRLAIGRGMALKIMVEE